MKLIIGLGNPGTKYALNRHNIGFMVIDALAMRNGASTFRSEHQALTTRVRWEGEDVLLAKPQTFMNLSGASTRNLLDFYKISNDDLLVAHDEVDLPFGEVKLQTRRGHGGHNGIRNVHQILGTDAYARLRIGVSRPSHPSMDVADYVLQNFSHEELNQMADFLAYSCEAIEAWAEIGFERAANRFNQRRTS